MEYSEELLDQARRAKGQPAWWVKNYLGDDLWDKQIQIINSVRDYLRVAVPSCHGVGKSFIAARTALWFLTCFPDSIVVTTAPTYRQVRNILWAELRSAWANAKVPLTAVPPNTTDLRISDKWFAFGFSTNDPNAAQGIHGKYILVIMDEAAGVDKNIWTAIEGILTHDMCRLLTIGNPTDPTSEFYRECRSPSTKTIPISAFDSPNFTEFGITPMDIADGSWLQKIEGKTLPRQFLTSPGWVAERLKKWGQDSPMYQARVLGQFPDQDEFTLLPLSWIEAAMANTLAPSEPTHISCDVARYGSNETVYGLRKGPHYRMLDAVRGKKTNEVGDDCIKFAQMHAAQSIKLDSAGLGVGVEDHIFRERSEMEEAGTPTPWVVDGVNVGTASSEPERFLNLRAEAYWGMRERLEENGLDLDPDDDELAAQLSNLKWKITPQGKIAIESKEDMLKRGIPSPDRADSVMLAYANSGEQDWSSMAPGTAVRIVGKRSSGRADW
jgi:phage terminase large subunit